MTNAVFVVGSPRSGTTYLSRALGLADDACYLGESALFCLAGARQDFRYYSDHMSPDNIFPYKVWLMRMLNRTDRIRGKNRVEDAVEHLILMSKVKKYGLEGSDTLYKVQGIQLDEQDRKELLSLTERLKQGLDRNGVGEFAKEYFGEYAKRKGKGTVVEKTPEHLRYLPVIHAAFPEAKVVLIQRDKQKCLESYFRTFDRGLGILRFLPIAVARGMVWRQLQEDEKREKWAIQQPWVCKVAFDDFVKDPVGQLGRITDWLGLSYNFEKYGSYFPEYKPQT